MRNLSRILSGRQGFQALPLLLSIVFVTTGVARTEQKTDLEGTWEGVDSVTEGLVKTFKPGEVRMVFTGDKLMATGILSHDERPVAFVINSAVSPKQFDFGTDKNSLAPCIYEIRADELLISVPANHTVRPKTISGDKGSGNVLLRLKRAK